MTFRMTESESGTDSENETYGSIESGESEITDEHLNSQVTEERNNTTGENTSVETAMGEDTHRKILEVIAD